MIGCEPLAQREHQSPARLSEPLCETVDGDTIWLVTLVIYVEETWNQGLKRGQRCCQQTNSREGRFGLASVVTAMHAMLQDYHDQVYCTVNETNETLKPKSITSFVFRLIKMWVLFCHHDCHCGNNLWKQWLLKIRSSQPGSALGCYSQLPLRYDQHSLIHFEV